MMISHQKIIAFQTVTNHSFWTFYIGGKPVVYIINRKIHGCLEIPNLFLVLNMILFTREISCSTLDGISAHPCIILYINSRCHLFWSHDKGLVIEYRGGGTIKI